MQRHLLFAAAMLAATAFAQENSSPARRSPEQIFPSLDRDKNGTLSEAEFGALKDKMPSLRDRPDGVSAVFKRLDKDGNGSLTLDEFRAMANQGPRRPRSPPRRPLQLLSRNPRLRPQLRSPDGLAGCPLPRPSRRPRRCH